jgi:prepilin peptidase CpaA
MFATTTAWAFAITTIVGAIIAIIQVLLSGQWKKHYTQFWMILSEIAIIRDPDKLSEMAAERKPTMRLLPYGIPIAIGTIMYFMWTGMYV